MEITIEQRIALMQLAKDIASREDPQNFMKRHSVEWRDNAPPTQVEMTLSAYHQLLAQVLDSPPK
ncbi:hypothetical protein MARPU_05635 [Marichromatium purpuratum 984]|uniref:Uncharacterized protein n=1 Tax=Marichromatium purpuratum 984 TaxID=765910 RepID=W0E3S4_MARPU|nr:hypothetical protein [Marichromatium purpuratum]AHF05407.1 hypothetical protein MARPU_05635 [Marichromatium purpuratum 984]